LKLFQLTFQLSWNFFQLTSKFCDPLFDLGLNGKIALLHSKRKQVHAVAIMTLRGRLKVQDWNLADQIAGLENAGQNVFNF